MLEIKNLTANYEDKDNILENINLSINKGEIHVLMGKNGSGKSTLLKAIAGDPEVNKSGDLFFNGKSLNDYDINEIANNGIFLSFQSPVVIEGVNNVQFIKQALEAKRNYLKLDKLNIGDFLVKIKSIMSKLNLDESFLNRNLNEGFSGGEKKKNEILQLLMLEPDLILLDEIDSGLDIDSIKIIANILNEYVKDSNKSLLIVTHYEKMLSYLKPDKVHIIKNKSIIKTGGAELITLIHEKGFDYAN